jgi:hypothetical protein
MYYIHSACRDPHSSEDICSFETINCQWEPMWTHYWRPVSTPCTDYNSLKTRNPSLHFWAMKVGRAVISVPYVMNRIRFYPWKFPKEVFTGHANCYLVGHVGNLIICGACFLRPCRYSRSLNFSLLVGRSITESSRSLLGLPIKIMAPASDL